jgi:uncharacterized protein YndB with AHSA1/START domain
MTDPVTHATFHIERVYDASPARVFAAFEDPEARRRWFIDGEGFETGEVKLDFRPGGVEHFSFRPEALDRSITNDTVYHEIVRDRRIVWSYAMAFEGEPPFSASLATIEITPEGSGARFRFTEQGAYLKADADHAAMRETGWNELIDALGREVDRQKQNA